MVAVRVHVPGPPVAGWDEREHAAARLRLPRDLGGQMRGDALDIFHERHGRFENVMVDALENVAHGLAALVEVDTVGVVDMAAAVRGGVQKIAGDFEMPRHGADVMFQIHAKIWSPRIFYHGLHGLHE